MEVLLASALTNGKETAAQELLPNGKEIQFDADFAGSFPYTHCLESLSWHTQKQLIKL
jgi:hypothetical protein